MNPQTAELDDFLLHWRDDSPVLTLHTSGSTGAPKAMQAEKERMRACARLTCQFLGLQRGNTALLCLPLHYIAGQMMVVRALTCGLRLLSVPSAARPLRPLVEDTTRMPTDGVIHLAAMVPLQVEQSLQDAREARLLRSVQHLLIGGGSIPAGLEEKLKGFPHAVWSTYGMTETLSHVALRRVNGEEASPWYMPLPHVAVGLGADGCLWVNAPLVCPRRLQTHDLAQLHPDGRRFRILGRRDNVVCSGGLKLHLEALEEALRPHVDVPFQFSKVPDSQLGEAAVLLVTRGDREVLARLCHAVMPRHWAPRHILLVPSLPLTDSGKPARAEAQRLALRFLSSKG